jgi:hypothetical protein
MGLAAPCKARSRHGVLRDSTKPNTCGEQRDKNLLFHA